MKTFISTLLFAITSLAGFAQIPTFIPPYHTLEQTIGESYVITPFNSHFKENYYVEGPNGKKLTAGDAGKSLKLIKIDNETLQKAFLVDSVGNEYKSSVINDKIQGLVPLTEITAAKQLVGKAFWINLTEIDKGIRTSDRTKDEIKGIRFTKVTITNASILGLSAFPITLTLTTANGEVGNTSVYLSGTNTNRDAKYAFATNFLTEDPKLKYHFTPAVWKMVQAGYTEIGMPMDAFQLVMGSPNDIHSTKTAKGTTYQWVYGTSSPTYYYFENGKLTAKQN